MSRAHDLREAAMRATQAADGGAIHRRAGIEGGPPFPAVTAKSMKAVASAIDTKGSPRTASATRAATSAIGRCDGERRVVSPS